MFYLRINSHYPGLGIEFAHRFSEQMARFLQKNEQMSDLLKKRAIRSFLVSDLSEKHFNKIL